MNYLARIGAALFVAWGLIHVVGGASILAALGDDAASAYATYRDSAGSYTPLSGSILGYFSYLLIVIGIATIAIGWAMNRRNSELGLVLNTAIVGATEVGLVWFLVLPGYVPWAQASVGLVPFALALLFSGMACRREPGLSA